MYHVKIYPIDSSYASPGTKPGEAEYHVTAESIREVTEYLAHQVPAFEYSGGECDEEVDQVWRVVVEDATPAPKSVKRSKAAE